MPDGIDITFATNTELIEELKRRSDMLVVLMRPLQDEGEGRITTCLAGKVSDLTWILEREKFDLLAKDSLREEEVDDGG